MIPNAMAEWIPVGESDEDGGYTVYVDLISARKAANRVKMWTLIDYKIEQKASGTNFLSKKSAVIMIARKNKCGIWHFHYSAGIWRKVNYCARIINRNSGKECRLEV